MISGAERNGYKLRRVTGGYPCRQANLYRRPTWAMNSLQAPWQRCRIICNDEIAPAEERRERDAGEMPYNAVALHDKQLGGSSLGMVGSNHVRSTT
jgi:hypothetical protein